MNPIKIRYTCVKPKHIFSQIFTLEEIEQGKAAKWMEVNITSSGIVHRDLWIGAQDGNENDIFVNDKLKWAINGKVYTMGFEECSFDLIDFDSYEHDWPIAFGNRLEWEVVGNIYL